MTFTIRHRGRGSLVSADYRCEQHGLFNVLAERDESGDPPAEQPCPAEVDAGDGSTSACGEPSPWTISAPGVHTQFVVSATQGKSEPPPHKLSMQTRSLAEGEKYGAWKKRRQDTWRDRRRAQLRKALGR